MSSKVLDSSPSQVRRFDVLTMSHPDSSRLMLHAVLSFEDGTRNDVTNVTRLKSYHMGPPLGITDKLTFDAVGTCDLSEQQNAQINEFVERQKQDRKAERKRRQKLGVKWDAREQYRIQPPFTRPNKNFPMWRYSCVGFVLLAYRNAKIELIDSPNSPLKTLDQIKQLYPEQQTRELDDPNTRQKVGLGNGDRWPVVLAGYLLHSLARPTAEVNGETSTPYTASDGDEFFPHASGNRTPEPL